MLLPEQLNPAVDETLSALAMQCLERDTTARFQSAADLERSLSNYLNTAVKRPGDIDVGAWMHELFPNEAARTEATEFRSRPSPGRLEQSTVATPQGLGTESQPALRSHALQPDLEAGNQHARAFTPNKVSDESSKRRIPMVDLAVYFGVGIGVLAIAWAVLSSLLGH